MKFQIYFKLHILLINRLDLYWLNKIKYFCILVNIEYLILAQTKVGLENHGLQLVKEWTVCNLAVGIAYWQVLVSVMTLCS